MSTRFKGATSGEILSQATVYNQDMIQTRHAVGSGTEDSDKGLPLSVIQSSPVAVCSTSASTINKTATIQNFSDFTLLNGREVIVYMANGNSASEPTMNINNTGNILMETSYWNAGTFLKLRYVAVVINGTTVQRWLVDQGASNTSIQLNGALTDMVKVRTINSGYYYNNLYQAIIDIWNTLPVGLSIFHIVGNGSASAGYIVDKMADTFGSIIENSSYSSDFGIRQIKLFAGSWSVITMATR